MLIKLPPAFKKSWREFLDYSPMVFIYWGLDLTFPGIV